MNELARWEEGNGRYLAAALGWLRLRMLRRVGPTAPDEAEVARAALAVADAETVEPAPALVLLARRFGLSRFEQDVLLLCAAVELDPSVAGLLAQAQEDPNRPYPTFALALTLFDEPSWDVLSPERPLRYWRLLEIHQPGSQPLTASALVADERVVHYLKGLNYLDDRLKPLLLPLEAPDRPLLPPSQAVVVEKLGRYLNDGAPNQRQALVHLLGPDASSKQLVAQVVAAGLGLRLYRLSVELLPGPGADLETWARLWQRESVLLPVALYLDAHEVERAVPGDGFASPLQRFLSRSRGIFFLATRDPLPGLGLSPLAVDIAKPTADEQQQAWAAALGPAAADSPPLLAGQFNLDSATILQVARAALTETPDGERSLGERLWDACLIRARPRLESLAQRIAPKAAWDDLVLPAPEMNLLRQIVGQVRQRSTVYDDWGFRRRMNRGLGLSVLFAGESGTGKTMAAEVLANHLRLDLYRIDLSTVVSKYIGETEKNLRRLFDAAEDGGAILFFDEADALFGKRSEVKDSHDRYANIEINYLLQRMEAYCGVAILATNLKSALDPAFLRRLRFLVNFPFPGLGERRAIWEKVFPSATPCESLDWDRLARFNLTGGSIHNIALNAAFLAAQAGTAVSMPLALEATRTELRKLERPVNEADFRWQTSTGRVP
jgi:hypothetical protein